MGTIPHQTIMRQVRRNLVTELLDHADKGPRQRNELLQFLAFEPVELTEDVYNRLAHLQTTAVLFGRMRQPVISNENPKPIFNSLSPRDLRSYAKQWCRYLFMKVFLKGLHRGLLMQDELRAMQMATFDPKALRAAGKAER
jgi:hypothetical protein